MKRIPWVVLQVTAASVLSIHCGNNNPPAEVSQPQAQPNLGDRRLESIQAELDLLRVQLAALEPPAVVPPSTPGQLLEVTLPPPTFNMVYIPPGNFQMGSGPEEPGHSENETLHNVSLSQGIWMASTELTQGVHWTVTGQAGSDTDWDISCVNCPAVTFDWEDAIEFCNALSRRTGLTSAYTREGDSWTWNSEANGYRLPTEAEWEYAARAGQRTVYSGSNEADEVSHGTGCIDCYTREMVYNYEAQAKCLSSNQCALHEYEVATRKPNAWGLYDMSGRFAEWTWDYYGALTPEEAVDPHGPDEGTVHVLRGAGYTQLERSRVAARWSDIEGRSNYIGLRLVRNAE